MQKLQKVKNIINKKLILVVAVSAIGITGLLGYTYNQRYIPEIEIDTKGRFVGYCRQSGGLNHTNFGKPIDIVVEEYKNGCIKVTITVANSNRFVLDISGDPRCFRLDWRELVVARLKLEATIEQAKSFFNHIYSREIKFCRDN